jgi:hypothetical protein
MFLTLNCGCTDLLCCHGRHCETGKDILLLYFDASEALTSQMAEASTFRTKVPESGE